MRLAQIGILSGGGGAYSDNSQNTTSEGEQVFWAIGDSNTDGRGESIPEVSSGILYVWDGDSWNEVTTGTVANDGDYGSAYQQFGTNYNGNTGRKVLIVNSGVGGSNLYPADASDHHWMGASGPEGIDEYAPAKAVLDAALAAKGLTKPKAIFIGGLGINDIEAGTSIENISTGLDALISNLTTDYPGVPILYTTTGRNGTTSIAVNMYNVRKLQIDKAEETTDLHICGAAASLIGAGLYSGDDIHFSQAGYNHIGSCYARWFKNSAYTNKWVRSIISSHFDDLSDVRKGIIKTAVETLYNSGDYFLLDSWFRGKTTIENNFFLDWTFLGHSLKTGSPTFNANTSIETPGSTSHMYNYISWDHSGSRSSVEDFVEFGELITRTSEAGASMFGGADADSDRFIGQTATNIVYRVNDGTTTTGPAGQLPTNKFIGIARDGGIKYYLEDSTVAHSESRASVDAGTFNARIGARTNNGGSATSAMAGSYGAFGKAKYTTFNYELFIEMNRYISDNW